MVGRSGTGKTTLGIDFILGTHHQRVAIADHEGEFATRLRVPLNLSWSAFYDALEKQRISCLDITEVDESGSEAAFDEMCAQVLDLQKTVFQGHGFDMLLVVDEVQKYTSAQYVSPHFKNCLETGRKWGLDTLSLSQRPNGINTAIREQFTEIFFFRMIEENSHKFGEYFGISAEEQSALADGEYIYLNMKTGERRPGRIDWAKKISA